MNRRLARILTTAPAVLVLFSAAPTQAQPATEDPGSGWACTITGGSGDDVLQGTPGDDVICGLGGDDVLLGYGGDDVLRGGPGDDVLVGGPGNDRLYGGDGDDQLVDTRDAGVVNGGAGDDMCVGVSAGTFSECERVFALPRGRAGAG